MLVVMPMSGCPPERSALHRSVADDSEYELRYARSPERFVRKISVIEGRVRKHPHQVANHRYGYRRPAPSHPENRKAAKVKYQIGHRTSYIESLLTVEPFRIRLKVRVESLVQRLDERLRDRSEFKART